MTQMVGRVLRQPGARLTGDPALDQCYVYSFDQAVTDAIEHVRKGLEQEAWVTLPVMFNRQHRRLRAVRLTSRADPYFAAQRSPRRWCL